jgi:hypothetical protein
MQGSSAWQQLQRMLITSILAPLGGRSRGRASAYINASGARLGHMREPQAGSPDVLGPGEGWALLLQCEGVREAYWAFRLYLAR